MRADPTRRGPPLVTRQCRAMGAALGYGALAASSLVIGALLGLARDWPPLVVGGVLAFGAGALISAVSFDLVEEGAALGGPGTIGLGLAAGALVYFGADRALERGGPDGGTALALGAFLDGIPEQLVLGIGLATGDGVSVGLLVAIFVSNLPEAIGSSTDMRAAKRPRGWILRLWIAVAAICTVHRVRLRRGRRRRRRPQGGHQRLRGRRAAGDADRLDDPRGEGEGRPRRGVAHRPRVRRRVQPGVSRDRPGVTPGG